MKNLIEWINKISKIREKVRMRMYCKFLLLPSIMWVTMDVLSYSIASGIPVTLTRVKCWNINHQNHKHTYSHEVHDQNDRSNRCNTLYDCDDWYFSIWQPSMSQEFQWQLSNWVGPLCTWTVNQNRNRLEKQKYVSL